MRYEVTIKQIETYSVVVEAASELSAKEAAWAMIDKRKDDFHVDSNSETSADKLVSRDKL